MRLTVATDLEPQRNCLVQAEMRRDQAIKTRDVASKLVETTRSELRILEDLATTRITGVINELKRGLTAERESRRNSGIGVNGQASTPSFEQTLQRTRIEGVEMAHMAIREEVAHKARLVEEAERDLSNAASALGIADARLVRVKQAVRLKEVLNNVESGEGNALAEDLGDSRDAGEAAMDHHYDGWRLADLAPAASGRERLN